MVEVSDEEAAKTLADFIKRAIVSGVDVGGDGGVGVLRWRPGDQEVTGTTLPYPHGRGGRGHV